MINGYILRRHPWGYVIAVDSETALPVGSTVGIMLALTQQPDIYQWHVIEKQSRLMVQKYTDEHTSFAYQLGFADVSVDLIKARMLCGQWNSNIKLT